MTGQLLKVTTSPLQVTRYTQSARLISSGSVDVERRKAIARMKAFKTQHASGQGNVDVNYVNMVNRTFAANASSSGSMQDFSSGKSNGISYSAVQTEAAPPPDSSVAALGTGTGSASAAPSQTSGTIASMETNSAYTLDRGAFELRVAKGELSFIPPLTMTVITQRPEIHFEYIGGFNYVPARDTDLGSMSLSI